METPVFVKNDPWLQPFEESIRARISHYQNKLNYIHDIFGDLYHMAAGFDYYGLHDEGDAYRLREWAPNATKIFLTGDFSQWKCNDRYQFIKKDNGNWEIYISKSVLKHGDLFKLHVFWEGGDGLRLPSYVQRVVQDPQTKIFSAQVWHVENEFQWEDEGFKPQINPLLIYEGHVGMSSEDEKVSSYSEFKSHVLPRIIKAGYTTIQLMAIQEHPYYGSFGYHVSNFFAVSSRFGTPEELKDLINEAHKNGIAVIMDMVHSHAVKNEVEGLGRFDGTVYQYFHDGAKGEHPAWDSKCFNYGKTEVLQFLLSNCRYWMEEFHFDGFRFDGVTSMLYVHHGLEYSFSSYADYYNGTEDMDAITYLTMANQLIHHINPHAITIAEDMSGMPGLADTIEHGGVGFNYRLSMGVPDFWIKMIKEKSDEHWNVGQMFHELSQHRFGEKTIAYAESHDQALVGDKTIFFRLVDKEMYDKMDLASESLIIDRGLALHKMIRLVTLATAYGGYLNFMGNEFGHPEWIDFPREGNGWSHKYARRQWSLMENPNLKFKFLSNFDKAMIDKAKSAYLVNNQPCYGVNINEADQVMCFKRGDFYFVFNFSPTNSYTDYGIFTDAGKYKIILSTDNPDFGGFGNVDESLIYYAQRMPFNNNQFQLKLYIPARTAFVMERIPPIRVH
ncbi:alpha-amylase family glycosyl hydrolase [Saccharicrinis fermentans]|uniref:1,4-alpha-glucan branching enzyme n=1 Tax=Saccharicrinis fermentans DSM 9555 = JCM 21142 TaxID=869213 RepID=W7Y8K1_9BACT|nr:alpha-amylase family glycosyl hydrolase [Saccharicrinis fermentans]GAF04028.1 1,4-alpha-glucan branching enzyme GlgB [Saccharicrinis fermentans DSM 9555 = JCM 21142]